MAEAGQDDDPRLYRGVLAAEPASGEETIPVVVPPAPASTETAPAKVEPAPAKTETAPKAEAAPPAKKKKKKKKRNLRIPSIPMGKYRVQPWVRNTLFTEYYRENYNTQQSDDNFVSLVNRLNVGADTRMDKVTLGTQVRMDGQKIWFVGGQDCSGDCVPVEDDVRLERVTVRADTKHVSVYAGDFNVNFGRGMGLSVRKIDEIGVDATIKGGRVDLRTKPIRATAIAGFGNRQNSDFATRQLIADPGYPAESYTFSPDTEDKLCNVSGAIDPDIGNPFWSVCSDLIGGGRVEASLPGKVDVGTHYVYLDFGDEITAGVIDEHLHQIGGDIGRARIAKVWDIFAGGSGVIRNPNLKGTPLESQGGEGYALYLSNVIVHKTTTFLVEAKHYRDYLVALNQSSLLQYTENPTLEREDQQVPGNQNATGGRVRVDHTWRKSGVTLFANSLEYVYSENVGFSQFEEDSRLATHNYGGIIWRKPKSDFVLQASAGYRHEHYLQRFQDFPLKRRFPHAELYLSIPLAKRGGLTHALSLRGEGRYENFVTQGGQEDFFRGLFVVGYSMSPWFSISFLQGVDTEQPTPDGEPSLTRERCREGAASTCRPHLWPGVQAQINFFNSSFIRIFAGRQVGGRVCVNGSCRTLPDFEGIRSELVFSF
ncbi:MAG: hypothetical protein AAF721_06345 [Myxococcota bacterium]